MEQGRETRGRVFGLGLGAEAAVRGSGDRSWLGDEDLGCGVEKEAGLEMVRCEEPHTRQQALEEKDGWGSRGTAVRHFLITCTCLHSVQLQIEAVQGLEAFRCLDVLGLTQHADVHGHLEVVLLLAHKSIISHRKVEALVSVHTIREHRPEGGKGGRG